jgi:indole-3-glycerol phosphate synthase
MSDDMLNDATKQPPRPIPAILQSIVAAAHQRVSDLRRAGTAAKQVSGATLSPKRSLVSVLANRAPAIIAEIKKASPSKGVFRAHFDPLKLALNYEAGGAVALSVVTEPQFFQGENRWLGDLRQKVSLPILRKDFIVEAIQVTESAALGADAILLIARILTEEKLRELKSAADAESLEVLFEIHDLDDLHKVAALRPAMIGINARNLDDFTVDTRHFHTLVSKLPTGVVAVAESGLDSPDQIAELSAAGFRGFLIGETLICADDPARTLKHLRGAD